MRPEHVAANRLIDIALTGNRQAYRTELDKIRAESSPIAYDNIVRLSAMQYRMQVNDYRYMTWRSDWIRQKQNGN